MVEHLLGIPKAPSLILSTHTKIKEANDHREKIFTIQIRNKWLILPICKRILELKDKKIKNQQKKNGQYIRTENSRRKHRWLLPTEKDAQPYTEEICK